MIFIVGGNGLTGSAFVRYMMQHNLEYVVIQKENKEQYIGARCDVLIYANGNALKYLANDDPMFDFVASVESVAFYLHNIKYKQFIHLSTVDVYPIKDSYTHTQEDVQIEPNKLSIYGYHKYLAEEYVKYFANNYLIFRLPGLVGKGLTKNPVYDFVHQDKKVFVSPLSTMNFIHTDIIASSVVSISNRGVCNEIFNLASCEGIAIDDIKNIVGFESKYVDNANNNLTNYEINIDKISAYCTLPSSLECISRYFYTLHENKEKL